MHQSYKDLIIEIKYGNKHVAESPYKLSGKSLLIQIISLNIIDIPGVAVDIFMIKGFV